MRLNKPLFGRIRFLPAVIVPLQHRRVWRASAHSVPGKIFLPEIYRAAGYGRGREVIKWITSPPPADQPAPTRTAIKFDNSRDEGLAWTRGLPAGDQRMLEE